MNSTVLNYVNKHYGGVSSCEYYNIIQLWEDWWRGYYEPFHRFNFNNGLQVIKRDLYSLKMAKKVCEDWAAILMNENTRAVIGDDRASEFILGQKETSGVFGRNCFYEQANRLVEKAFYSGTAAVTISLDGAVNNGDRLTADDKTTVGLHYISADSIIPISVHNGRITEAAFCSERIVNGKTYALVEVHKKNELGNYVIYNKYFHTSNGVFSEEKLPDGMIEEFDTASSVPWFSILTPNIENCIENNNGMGISVFAGAIDILKGIDIAFNNMVKDFELGQKKVFMQRSLLENLDDGTTVAPDDVCQQLFNYVSESMGNEAQPFISEFNPTIRVQENKDGIQSLLDYLSFKCGLGNKHYQFNAGSIVTATQYVGDKQDLIQNAHKHYKTVEHFLITLIRSLIHIGNTYFALGADAECDIKIEFDRSVLIDEASERAQDMQDVRDGLMLPWEYRQKWYSESEDTARAKIEEIKGAEPADEELMGFDDGGA